MWQEISSPLQIIDLITKTINNGHWQKNKGKMQTIDN